MKIAGPAAGPAGYDVDIAIVGAGVSGLTAAYLLHEAGQRVRVYEAAEVIGGRVQSFRDAQTGLDLGDRGPTWVWPAYQPTLASWLTRLDLRTVAQFDDGRAIIETAPGQPPAMATLPGQFGSMRIEGGTRQLVEALARRLPREAVATRAAIGRIECVADGIALYHERGSQAALRARGVIVAVPPRVAANAITWAPQLPAALMTALQAIPTWMASHAKAVVVYDRPFWRKIGLSGRIASRVGPLAEVHDHSGADGQTAALFGFFGWPPQIRERYRAELSSRIIEQLARCFGAAATTAKDVFIEDWATNPRIAQRDDLSGPQAPPGVGPSILRDMIYRDRLAFASAEVSQVGPGVLEGALHAAEHAASMLLSALQKQDGR